MMVNQWLMMANGHSPSLQMVSRYFVKEWSSKKNCCDHVVWVNESMIIISYRILVDHTVRERRCDID